jgi:hypothetical protein
MNKTRTSPSVFAITEEDVQLQAMEKIGRKVKKEEMETVKKGLEWGILTGIDPIYQTIFHEMLEK